MVRNNKMISLNINEWFSIGEWCYIERGDANSFSLSSVIITESQSERRVKHNNVMIISKPYERDDSDRRDIIFNNALTYPPPPSTTLAKI